jgi:hypothetical protein
MSWALKLPRWLPFRLSPRAIPPFKPTGLTPFEEITLATLAQFQADLATLSTQVDQLITLTQSLAQQLAALQSTGITTPAQFDALAATVANEGAKVQAAITTYTPAAPAPTAGSPLRWP